MLYWPWLSKSGLYSDRPMPWSLYGLAAAKHQITPLTGSQLANWIGKCIKCALAHNGRLLVDGGVFTAVLQANLHPITGAQLLAVANGLLLVVNNGIATAKGGQWA